MTQKFKRYDEKDDDRVRSTSISEVPFGDYYLAEEIDVYVAECESRAKYYGQKWADEAARVEKANERIAELENRLNLDKKYYRSGCGCHIEDTLPEPTIVSICDFHKKSYPEELKRKADLYDEHNKWLPIETVKLGEMVMLKGGAWRHEWAGQVINHDTGECVLDSPTPEHKVGIHFATHWKPLLTGAKIIPDGMRIKLEAIEQFKESE